MSTPDYINRLERLKEGERSRLRSLAGMPLDARLDGFDLFTGLWWPLRATNERAPRREPSWLVAKLFGAFGFAVPHARSEGQKMRPTLPAVLGACEPRHERNGPRFRTRFDALLCSPLSALEPHLRWALDEIARAAQGCGVTGIDWARLLDDLSLWDRGYNPDDTRQVHRLQTHAQAFRCSEMHPRPQDLWACEYLVKAGNTREGA